MKHCLICIGITLSTCNTMHSAHRKVSHSIQFNCNSISSFALSYFCFQYVEFRFASGIFEGIHERKTIPIFVKKSEMNSRRRRRRKHEIELMKSFIFHIHEWMNAHTLRYIVFLKHSFRRRIEWNEHVHVLTNVLNCGKWIVQLAEQQQQQRRWWCHQSFSLCCIYAWRVYGMHLMARNRKSFIFIICNKITNNARSQAKEKLREHYVKES